MTVPASPSPMFSRDELLGGLPARRASTILFAIEGTTARLVAASRVSRVAYVGERTAAERERAFLQAVSAGDQATASRLQDLERFAAGWAELVPDAPDVRAAIARLLAAKHRFRRTDVPGIRSSLGLDDPAVAAAYARLYGSPLGSIYQPALPARDRLRWRLARVVARFDRLPPFWIAYFLALTETLGEGFLSLPLALVGFGPLPGVVLLVVLGVVNMITMGAMAEAVIRNGNMRYGTSFIGRLVTDLLGRVPASTLGVVFAFDGLITFWFYFLGFGSVLAGATGIPIGAWIVVLLLINVAILRNESLDDTIASAVAIGTATLVIALAITAIAIVNIDPANVGYVNVPILNGQPIDAAALGLVFGIILMAFFGHSSAANSAKLLLTLEPTGRALMRGNLAAMATVIVVYSIASVAILGALGTAPLVGTDGTALTPLADKLGPVVSVLCVAYTFLAIGVGSLYVTLGTYNQAVELLPAPSRGGILARLAATRRGRAVVGFAPLILVAIAVEIAVVLGADDFAAAVGVGGAITVPIITGVFPMLLVWAARRKGEYVPGGLIRILGHRVTVVALLVLYTAAVFAHALIWEHPLARGAALASGFAIVGLIAWVVRRQVFRPRAVVELRVDRRSRRTTVSVTAEGHALVHEAPVDGGTAITTLPPGAWRQLRVWPHEVSPDGTSTALAAQVEVNGDAPASVAGRDGSVFEIDGQPTTVVLRLQAQEGTA